MPQKWQPGGCGHLGAQEEALGQERDHNRGQDGEESLDQRSKLVLRSDAGIVTYSL